MDLVKDTSAYREARASTNRSGLTDCNPLTVNGPLTGPEMSDRMTGSAVGLNVVQNPFCNVRSNNSWSYLKR